MKEWGLIADTHGLMRPEALEALAGVAGILHAGDVGKPEVLEPLRQIAPLTVVRGNVDRGPWAERLPETAEVDCGGVWVHMRHILADLDLDPHAAGFGVVITGHSHQPAIERRGEVLFVNPGSAGPRRFRLPISLGRLWIEQGRAQARIVELSVD